MRLKPEIGLVPPEIKTILDKQMLSATSWLGDFTEKDIEELQKSVREMGMKVGPEERRQFLGDYWTCPGDFQFTVFQKKCIRRIAQAISDRGIAFFIEPKRQDSNTHPDAEFYQDPVDRNALIEKLIDSDFAKYELKLSNICSDSF